MKIDLLGIYFGNCNNNEINSRTTKQRNRPTRTRTLIQANLQIFAQIKIHIVEAVQIDVAEGLDTMNDTNYVRGFDGKINRL